MIELSLRSEHAGKKIGLTMHVDIAPDAPREALEKECVFCGEQLARSLAGFWVNDALKSLTGEPLLDRLVELGYDREHAQRLAESSHAESQET